MMDRMWSWATGYALAALLLVAWAYPKLLAGLEVHPVLGLAEARSGIAFFDPELRYVIGGAIVAAALMLVIPKTRLAGAVVALLVSVFYFGLHVSPWLGADIPSYGPLMAALESGRTAEQIQALGLGTDRAAHLSLVLTNLVLAGMVVAAEVMRLRTRTRPSEAPLKPAFG
jgi:hypothetical protein